jgi:hypothetical protein
MSQTNDHLAEKMLLLLDALEAAREDAHALRMELIGHAATIGHLRERAQKAERELGRIKAECDNGSCPSAQHERMAAAERKEAQP